MFGSALGSEFNIAETLVKAAPMIFTGLAVAVAFRAKFWNIGAEGQLMAGAVAAAFVGAYPDARPARHARDGAGRCGGRRAGRAGAGAAARQPQGGRRGELAAPQLGRLFRHHGADRGAVEGPVQRLSDLAADRGFGRLPQAHRRHAAASRRACRLRRGRPRLVPDVAHHARLQDPHHRRECRGRALWRHRRRPGHRRHRADLRRAGGAGRRRRGRRRALPGDERPLARLRLQRHRHRHAGAGSTRSAWCRRRSSSPSS